MREHRVPRNVVVRLGRNQRFRRLIYGPGWLYLAREGQERSIWAKIDDKIAGITTFLALRGGT